VVGWRRPTSSAAVPGLGHRVEHDDGDVVLAAGGVGRVDQGVRGRRGVGSARRMSAIPVGPTLDVSRRADDHAVAAEQDERVHVDLDRRVDAKRARDDRSLRVDRGLFPR